MRGTNLTDEEEVIVFVRKAAKHFEENKSHSSFSDLEKGGLFALRYGLCDDCIVVFRISDDFEPVNFHQIIEKGER